MVGTDAEQRRAHREAALAHVAELITHLQTANLQDGPALLDVAGHLQRAITAFHLEAIRFRMYTLERAIRLQGITGPIADSFNAIRRELEAAGFATRSHG
ncbi:MAG TPA: hypothetical protein VIL35_09665 [Vicinamibacterales bacterium]